MKDKKEYLYNKEFDRMTSCLSHDVYDVLYGDGNNKDHTEIVNEDEEDEDNNI